MQKGKAWRRGLRELHTFKTLRFRGQSHIGVPPASAACGVDEHCLSPQSPGENTIIERLCQWVKSLFPHAPNGCLSAGFPNNPFQSLQRRLLLVKRSGRPNGPIQKEPKPINSETVVCTDGSGCCTHGSGCCTPGSGCFLVLSIASFGPKTGFRAENEPKTEDNGPKTGRKTALRKSNVPPAKKNRGVRPPKSKPFFRVPFLIMRKVLNQG